MLIAPSLALSYNAIPKNYRLLWHQTLDTILRYPEIPRRTTNFDMYPVAKLRHNNQITLGGSVTTVHAKYLTDAVITETWLADNLSMRAGFFYELLHFYNANLSSSDHLLWYPADKTNKVFSIQPLDLICGSGEDMEVDPIHGLGQNDYRWLRSEVKFSFRIRKLYDTPNAVVEMEGT